MQYKEVYNFWMRNDYFDTDTKNELDLIKNSEQEIEDRFYKELEFGTGGLRGIIGAGTNRINIYTIRKATQGLAGYLKKSADNSEKSVVIAYDSRRSSYEFAKEASLVLAANGIKAYLFDTLRPTPLLSFAVRYLSASGGIVITASHNPKQYNGYKVYGKDGAQLSTEFSDMIFKEIDSISDITKVKIVDVKKAIKEGLFCSIGAEIDDEYSKLVGALTIDPLALKKYAKDCKIVFTPLHGTGRVLVNRVLKEAGFENVVVVKEQEMPDPEFPTVRYLNPEEKDCYEIAIEYAKKENANIILVTDPDCDRVGVAAKTNNSSYNILTGNQIGCLILEYILFQRSKMGVNTKNDFVVKTIVTTELAKKISERYNVELIEVLTGFKFIGEKIKELDEYGDKKYIFGFEESYGYLHGTFVRDKDAVIASLLIAEVTVYYISRGMTLNEGLDEIYKKYGYAKEDTVSISTEGKEGTEKVDCIMRSLRAQGELNINGFTINEINDFRGDAADLIKVPKADVLRYETTDGSWFCIRPSGTEPKIKIYFGVCAEDGEKAYTRLENLKSAVLAQIDKLML